MHYILKITIMKKTLTIIAISLASMVCTAQLNAQNKLTVKIDGIETIKGSILISLFNSADTFMKKSITGKKTEVTGKTVIISFKDIPNGEYAITLFQDENDNRKLDTGIFGIPKEKYGFSNNAKATMGPPKYSACKFEVKEDTTIDIKL